MAAYGTGNVQAFGAGVSDIFAGLGDADKMKADELEASQYTQAADLALQNEQFTKQSTEIKEAQDTRTITQAMGRTTAGVAAAGFAQSGTALSLLSSNAQQGAIQKAVANEQGLVTEAGYQEQASSYETMASVANDAAKAANLAETGSYIAAAFSFGSAAIPR
jgi:hypothetical protein